jgi:hypothetical protein
LATRYLPRPAKTSPDFAGRTFGEVDDKELGSDSGTGEG